jgi:hypothetical protein
MTPEQRAEELAFMQDENQWPKWPYLPMKQSQKHGPPNVGYMVAGNVPTIHKENVWTFGRTSTAAPMNSNKVVYQSYEAILDDGWEID